jgi:Nitrogen fixation protein NifW
MSAAVPPAATDLLAAVKAAGSAEEIFALLGVSYDPKRLNVARLHILKRMSAHLAEADLDTLPADVVQSRLKDALARAYADFASASPLELRVFKVLQQAAEPDGAAASEPAAFVSIDTLRTS